MIQNISNPRRASIDIIRPLGKDFFSFSSFDIFPFLFFCGTPPPFISSLIPIITARDWSRTSTTLRSLAPQASASAYSATRAFRFTIYYCQFIPSNNGGLPIRYNIDYGLSILNSEIREICPPKYSVEKVLF